MFNSQFTVSSLAAVVVVAGAVAAAHPPGPAAAADTQLILLGTGVPSPDADRWGPASAVIVGNRLFLIDAGAGVTRRLAAAGFPRVHDIEATFITHLHSDHTLGYPDLIFTTWIMGRSAPLQVYGPPGLKRMTDKILDAWSEDIDVRVNGLERETRAWLDVDVHEISPGVVYDRNDVRVTAFPAPHTTWKKAFGYRFDTPGKSITFSGDTAVNEELVRVAKGTDILVHEVYDSKRAKAENRPGGEFWPQYLASAHTSDVDVGRLAERIKPKLLVLDHIVLGGGTFDEVVEGVRAGGYTGKVVVAKDLDRY